MKAEEYCELSVDPDSDEHCVPTGWYDSTIDVIFPNFNS